MAGETILHAFGTNGRLYPVKTVDAGDGTRKLVVDLGAATVTLTASELEIGAVTLKNDTTNEEATIATAAQAVDADHPLVGLGIALPNEAGTAWDLPRLDVGNLLETVTPNKANWGVRQISATTGGDAGPDLAVPNGFSVAVIASDGNTDDVYVGAVGESGAAATSFTLHPGDALPVTLSVTNLDKIEATSATGTQTVKLIMDAKA